MYTLPAVAADHAVRVLSASPLSEDHAALEQLVGSQQWTIDKAFTLEQANLLMRHGSFLLVVCEHNLIPGTWKDLLEIIGPLRNPPFFIVTSRHADEHLWSEALNFGAYDVLAKPFASNEVLRSFNMALMHWRFQINLAVPRVRASGRSRGTS